MAFIRRETINRLPTSLLLTVEIINISKTKYSEHHENFLSWGPLPLLSLNPPQVVSHHYSQGRQCNYTREAHSRNHSSRGKAIGSLCYPTCKANAPIYILTCGMSRCTTCFHIISQMIRFAKIKVTEHKMCVLIFSTIFVSNISRSKKKSARYYHKCSYVFI